MPVDVADVARVRSMADALPDSGELQVLETIPEALAYLVQVAREEGCDEVQYVELIAAAAELSRANLREARDVLRRLGYVEVATRLGEMARTKRALMITRHVPSSEII